VAEGLSDPTAGRAARSPLLDGLGREKNDSPAVTYALLIYRSMPLSEVLPESEEKRALAAHRALQVDTSRRGELHAVARLDEPGRARTVKWREGGHDVTDGPYIETKEWLVGFYLVDCATEQEAIERGRAICNDRHHVIEVRPVSWRWKR
jgi:hypothetical protein